MTKQNKNKKNEDKKKSRTTMIFLLEGEIEKKNNFNRKTKINQKNKNRIGKHNIP